MIARPGDASPLARLRLRLTAWYVGTFLVILALLGGGLFVIVRGQLSQQLDASLADATAEIARAAATRELEATTARGKVVDAVEELRIPERQLFLFAADATPLVPASPPEWTARVAAATAGDSVVVGSHEAAHAHELRYRGERRTLPSGTRIVAVAAADRIELESRYAALIAAFGAAAAAGLIMVGAGGWLLVRKSTQPVEATMERMRRFMADAAHELRTPVTVIRSRADVALQRPRDAGELAATVRVMGAEARRLGRIVDDLMTLARADAGDRSIEMRPVSLDDVVASAVETARAMADARGVALDVARFEEAWVNGDEHLLHQLVMILLDNGVKFTPSGGRVTVEVATAGDRASVAVRDTGQGISATELPHLFDRFFRGDLARTRGEPSGTGAGGAGLGLSIARWIADLHGAVIAVQSAGAGAGAEFRVTFPRIRPDDS